MNILDDEVDVPSQVSPGFLARLPGAIGFPREKVADYTATLPDTLTTSVFLALDRARSTVTTTRFAGLAALAAVLLIGAATWTTHRADRLNQEARFRTAIAVLAAAEQNLNVPLLSDFNRTASKAYESIYETFIMGMEGVSKRSAFVIDKEGIIRYAEVLDNAGEIPNFEAINNVLGQL